MELMWFFCGALLMAVVWGLRTWLTRTGRRLSWLSWTTITVDVLLFLFTLAWAISSIQEGEPQAAGMGLLCFGGASLIVLALARRSVARDASK